MMAPAPDIGGYPAEHGDVERAFVGALLQADAAAVLGHGSTVQPADLVDPVSRWCWRAMRSAAAAGHDPDALVLVAAARDTGLTIPPGWRSAPLTELSRLRDHGPPPAAADHFADLVAENSERRRLHHLGSLVAARAYIAPICEVRALAAELTRTPIA